ncbi:kinase [Micromonospora chersina]|uniref:kinase n=1 Tax=Micromonospora chersina TaxID=47854 RepID=UPI00371DD16B
MKGVILYGPPAAGKDTITAELTIINREMGLFRRLKVGGGRTDTYRMTDVHHVEFLRTRGEILWENARYNALYLIDRPALLEHLAKGIPVLHLGQVEAVEAIRKAVPDCKWLIVSLICDRRTAQARISARSTGDDAARMRAWDETASLPCADLTIDTAALSAKQSAKLIVHHVQRLGVSSAA